LFKEPVRTRLTLFSGAKQIFITLYAKGHFAVNQQRDTHCTLYRRDTSLLINDEIFGVRINERLRKQKLAVDQGDRQRRISTTQDTLFNFTQSVDVNICQ
jgi:hypothetical protein